MVIGRDLIESQKLYSTGDDDLDELLEMAFSDGYEYAQYEFSEKDQKKKKKKKYKNDSHSGYGRAVLISGALGQFGAGGLAGRYVGKREVEKALEEGDDLETAKDRGLKKAAIAGAIGGGAVQGLAGARMGVAVPGVLIGAGRGALGGYFGTRRNNLDWHEDNDDDD